MAFFLFDVCICMGEKHTKKKKKGETAEERSDSGFLVVAVEGVFSSQYFFLFCPDISD